MAKTAPSTESDVNLEVSCFICVIEDFKIELTLLGYSRHTISNYSYTIKNFLSYIDLEDETSVSNIRERDVKRFLVHLQNKGDSKKTLNRHLNAIKIFLKYNKVKIGEDIKLSKVPRSLPETLSYEDVDKFLNSIDKLKNKSRDKVMFRLLYASGIRVSELVNLNEGDVANCVVRIRCGKGEKDRITYIDEQTQRMIERYIHSKNKYSRHICADLKDADEAGTGGENNPGAGAGGKKPLFISNHGKRISPRTVQYLAKRYSKLAGIDYLTPHTLRHCFATHLLQNDADLVVIQNLLGHANLSTTQVYLNITDKHREDSYRMAHPLAGRCNTENPDD